jgi:1,4-alpha-glucan branching enzyme
VSGSPSNGSWWREGVLYQIYPRSFADSGGDGIGDLRGIVDRLDYLAWLGVAGIWLNPVTASPDRDWGYDVSDYRSVHPELGTIEDLDRLVAEAGRRDIRVLLDLFCPTTPATSTRGSSIPGPAARRRTGTGTCGPIPSRTARPPTTG